MKTRLFWWVAAVGLAAAVGACDETRKKKSSNDDDDSGTTETGSPASAGAGAGSSGTDCVALCNKVGTAACANHDSENCVSDCGAGEAQVPKECKGSYDALIACALGSGTYSCNVEGDAVLGGCDDQSASYGACLANAGSGGSGAGGTTSSSTSGAGGSVGPGCYQGMGSCDPLVSDSCTEAGAACDLGSDGMFTCFGPPNDAIDGGACSNSAGPYCGHGLLCDPGSMTCRPYCCTDLDCSVGSCTEIDTGATVVVRGCK